MAGKTEQGGILNEYFQQFLSFVFSGLEEHATGIIQRFFYFLDFKKRIQRYVVFLVVLATAFTIFIYGLGVFLSSFFPAVAPSIIPMALGCVLILAALLFRKLY